MSIYLLRFNITIPSIYKEYARLLFTLSLGLNLVACAAVNPVQEQPFDDYQQAISQLTQQSEAALKTVADNELRLYKKAISSDDNHPFNALILDFPPDRPFGWCYGSEQNTASDDINSSIEDAGRETATSVQNPCPSAPPLFAQVDSMQQTLVQLNQQLLNYAANLVALAGADDTTQFNPMSAAQEFETASESLLQQISTINANAKPVNPKGLALFSTVAANLAANYIEHKRKEDLAAVLQAGIQPLTQFAETIQQAMDITAQNVKDQFLTQRLPVLRQLARAQGEARSTPLEQLFQLNDKLQKQLTTLHSLAQAYGALPASQRQLIAALNQNRHANLAQLVHYATQIKQQYQTLKSTDTQ